LARHGYLNPQNEQLSRERVRQIDEGAMAKLRRIIQIKIEYSVCFRDYLYGESKPEDSAVNHISLEQALEQLEPIERRVLSLRYSSLAKIRRRAVDELRDLTGIKSIEDILKSVQFLNSL